VSTQVTDLVTKPRDKRSHNFIFSMLKRYHYLVNPLCAMAAQRQFVECCDRDILDWFALFES
jgi:hypothetical protein